MGNKQSSRVPLTDVMKFDRVIDGEEEIYIGIVPKKVELPMYSTQGIRIGNYGKLKRMVMYEKFENGMRFIYETGTTLTITKKNNDVLLDIKDEKINISKQMNPYCLKYIKPIDFGESSVEYDEMINFINLKK